MKILTNREVFTPPPPAIYLYQILTYDDGSKEYDAYCTQTTPILTAELYNGKAAKDDAGNWVPAPGPRTHETDVDLLGFTVAFTFVGFDNDNHHALYDYSVTTPTGVTFHARPGYEIGVPSNYDADRIAAEIIAWTCLTLDEIADWDDLSPERRAWAASDECESLRGDIDEWVEQYDRNL